jgi:hypothetical protein
LKSALAGHYAPIQTPELYVRTVDEFLGGTVYATTVVHPIEGMPFNVALIDCDD